VGTSSKIAAAALALVLCSCTGDQPDEHAVPAPEQVASAPIVGECPDVDDFALRAVEPLDWPWRKVEYAAGYEPEPRPVLARDPFAADWLTAEYQFDSREGVRVLSLEGHSGRFERVDVYGSLDLYSSLDDDLARFALRSGAFYRVTPVAGAMVWYEDFTGSWNETARVGGYYDLATGGEKPFCRLELLPIATDGGGVMSRAQFEFAIRERWTLGGFAEAALWCDGDDWGAAEPELRYELRDGVWATLEYRDDSRWDDEDGFALGLRAAL